MSSVISGNHQQKDASSSGSTQLSISSAASGNNNSVKMGEDKSLTIGKRQRGSRAGTKRRLDTGQKQRQLIRYDRDSLLQLRDSRLSSAWPRALDRAYIGEGGLWDPVKLFEGEKKCAIEGKTKIERVRNVRVTQPFSNPPGAEDSNSFGRSSRRRKRTKEESPLMSAPPRQQRVWPPSSATSASGNAAVVTEATDASRSKSESEKEKENKRNLQQQQQQQQQQSQLQLQRPRGSQPEELGPRNSLLGAPTLPPRLGSAAAAAGGATVPVRRPALERRGPITLSTGVWERSQGPRDQHHYAQHQRYRSDGVSGEEEELPAWFDEGPLDKMEKLELTGLPEDMEASSEDSAAAQPQPASMTLQPVSTTTAETAQRREHQPTQQAFATSSSRFAKWLAAEPTVDEQEASDAFAGQESGGAAQQQLERIFQDMRGRRYHGHHHQDSAPAAAATGPSLMYLLRPSSPSSMPVATSTDRPFHAQEVEASLKSMLFGRPAASSAAVAAASAPPAGTTAAVAHGTSAAMPTLPPSAHARTLEEIESSLGAVECGGSRGGGGSGQDSRAIYKLIGELQIQMHDAAASAGSSGTFGRQTAVPSLVTGSRQSQQHQQPKHQQPQQQPQLPQAGQSPFPQPQTPRGQAVPPPGFPTPSFSSAAAAAAAASQRRFPAPLQAQQLQQLQAMLLSNLQMQAQMMHNGQLSTNSAKTHPLSKLLPQPFLYRPPNLYLQRNNALHGTRLLNQNFNQPGAAGLAGVNGIDFSSIGFDTAAASGLADISGSVAAAPTAGSAYRRPPGASAAAAAAAACRSGLQQLQHQQSPMPQPAMPIVPPMLFSSKPPNSTSSATAAAAAAAAAAQQGWGGAHHHSQQISAMLWNATKLAASVKSGGGSGGGQPLSAGAAAWTPSQPILPNSAATVAGTVDEMPSA